MGEVYRARDTRLGRDVAVKVLPASFASDPERLRRFEAEARAAGMLNHPNILAVYDIGTQDGAPYLVTELLEGQTLRERLAEGPVPARKAFDYARQVASGLAAAHEKGITHRDLKPDNLFLTRDGHVKILDFGLAKLTQPEVDPANAATLTHPGTVLGTAAYMSPEQVSGAVIDHRSDIFSFGAVFYEVLTGEQAFRSGTVVEIMTAVLRADPPKLAELPAGSQRVVAHCLEKAPLDRFQSARDLGFALESLSDSGRTRPPQTQPARPRRRLRVAIAAVAVVAALAGAFVLGRRTGDAPTVSYKRLTFRRGTIYSARFAPEGKTVVYSAAWDGKAPDLFQTCVDILTDREHR